MRILYGVQGTGNGHISRSRETVKALTTRGHQVQVLISGCPPGKLPPLPEFGAYITRRGFTFVTHRGKIRHARTALQLNLHRFYCDIRRFDATGYDLVITDFEPLSARIARRAGLPCIGLGHQYAFFYDIPLAGANFLTLWLIRNFAFCDQAVGLHWHHFDRPLLPPIIPPLKPGATVSGNRLILVYLPFESLSAIRGLLRPIAGCLFYIYGKTRSVVDEDHLHFRPFSREGFLSDLRRCSGVICNAGFELPSEALQLGKKLLVRPLGGQMEQVTNAAALQRLGLGSVMKRLESDAVRRWLELPDGVPQRYPDVAELTADWIDRGYRPTELAVLSRQAWQGVPGLRTGAKKRLAVPSRSHAEGFNRGQSHLSGESDGED